MTQDNMAAMREPAEVLKMLEDPETREVFGALLTLEEIDCNDSIVITTAICHLKVWLEDHQQSLASAGNGWRERETVCEMPDDEYLEKLRDDLVTIHISAFVNGERMTKEMKDEMLMFIYRTCIKAGQLIENCILPLPPAPTVPGE